MQSLVGGTPDRCKRIRDMARDSRDRTQSDRRDQRRLELLTIETGNCNMVGRFAKISLVIGHAIVEHRHRVA